MQLGVIDLGPLGGPLVRRLLESGHHCVVHDECPRLVAELAAEGAYGVASVADVARELDPPRTVLLASPSTTVDEVLDRLASDLAAHDIVVDCADAFHVDDGRRASRFEARGVHYVDVGLSGSIAPGQGYCLTIGGDSEVVRRLEPLFRDLARQRCGCAAQAGAPSRQAPEGYLHCGPAGAGHFVNMVGHRLERRLMEAYAEGFSLLRAAKAGRDAAYDLDLAGIADVWRHGSFIASPVLDVVARALSDETVADLRDRTDDAFAARLLAAMRWQSPATAGLWAHDRPRHADCPACVDEPGAVE